MKRRLRCFVLAIIFSCIIVAGKAEGLTVYAYQDDVAFYSQEGKIGLIGRNGNLLSTNQYDTALPFYYGLSIVSKDGLYGILSSSGEEIFPCEYSSIYQMGNDLYILEMNGKCRIFQISEKICTDFLDCEIEMYMNDTLVSCDHTTYKDGVMDKSGNYIIQPGWEAATSFIFGWSRVMNDEYRYNFVNEKGQLLLDSFVDYCEVFSGSHTVIRKNEEYFIIDNAGVPLVETGFAEAFSLNDDGLFWVRYQDENYYFDCVSRRMEPCPWDWVEGFCDGLAAVMEDGLWGYIDESLSLRIPCIYEYVNGFCNRKAIVRENGREHYIDTQGDALFDRDFDLAYNFSDGYAAVVIQGKFGFIDENGNMAILPQYESPQEIFFSNGFCEIQTYDWCHTYFINKKGEIVCEY